MKDTDLLLKYLDRNKDVLVLGACGSGKTTLVKKACQNQNAVHVEFLGNTTLPEVPEGEIDILVLDGADAVIAREPEAIMKLIDRVQQQNGKVIVTLQMLHSAIANIPRLHRFAVIQL